MTGTLMSWAGTLAVLASLALIVGGLWLWNRDRKRSLLMLLAAAVTLLNVYSWTTMPKVPAQPASPAQAEKAAPPPEAERVAQPPTG